MAAKLGMPALLGPAGRQGDLALALVISRMAHPGSKLSTIAGWDTTLGADLRIPDAATGEVYAAMDWLGRPARMASRRRLPSAPRGGGEPVTEGAVRPVELVAGGLAHQMGGARLLPRRKGGRRPDQIGLLTDPADRPVAC